MSLCRALTIVLCLPDGICHSPQAREDKEDGQLGRVRAPQEEDDNAKEVKGSTWSEDARQDSGWLPLCLRWPGPQVACVGTICTHGLVDFLMLSYSA